MRLHPPMGWDSECGLSQPRRRREAALLAICESACGKALVVGSPSPSSPGRTGASQERLTAVRAYVAAVAGCSADSLLAVSRFDEGNRHDVYKVSCADPGGAATEVVVRVSLDDDPAERAQAQREAAVLEVVGGSGAPLLYDFSPTSAWFDTPVMCMSFVPGRHLPLAEATPAQIERLGGVAADVHGHPADQLAAQLGEPGDIASYAATRLRSILAGMAWVREPLPAPVRHRLRDAATSLERDWGRWRSAESFLTGETLVLLHGDIALGNVLWSPDPVLIDWEYARLGDPADEIAYLFDQNGLTSPQRAAFWRGYRTQSSDPARVRHAMERALWWEPVTLLGSTLWWVERWVRRNDAEATGHVDAAATKEPGYYLDQVIRRLERLGKLLAHRPPAA